MASQHFEGLRVDVEQEHLGAGGRQVLAAEIEPRQALSLVDNLAVGGGETVVDAQRRYAAVARTLVVLDADQLTANESALAETLFLRGPARLGPGEQPIDQGQEQQQRPGHDPTGIEI